MCFINSPPAIPTMGRGRSIPQDMEERTPQIRFPQGYQLAMAINGRSDDQITALGEKNAALIPQTAPNKGQNAVYLLMDMEYRLVLLLMELIGTPCPSVSKLRF